MGDKFHRVKTLKKKFSSLEISSKLKKVTDKCVSKGISKKQTIVICSLLIACLVVVLIPSKQIETPEATMSEIETAIFNADASTISKLVKVENISKQMATAVLAEVESKKLTADLLSYMHKELENKITADFFNIVENKGDFYKNLENPNAVLSKTLKFLAGDAGSVTKRSVIELTEKRSVVELTVFRPDLEKEIKINLVFNHNDFNWVLTEIADMDKLLAQLEEIEAARIEKLNKGIQAQINKVLILKDFQKSNINLEDNSFLIRLSLENISKEDIASVKGKLKMMDKDQVIGMIDININDVIFANNFYEKAWGIKLTDYQSLKNIVKTKSANFNAKFEIEEVVFAEGKVLKVIK